MSDDDRQRSVCVAVKVCILKFTSLIKYFGNLTFLDLLFFLSFSLFDFDASSCSSSSWFSFSGSGGSGNFTTHCINCNANAVTICIDSSALSLKKQSMKYFSVWKLDFFIYSRFSLSRIPRDSLKHFEISIPRHIRVERVKKTINWTTTFNKWICNLTPEVRNIYKIMWKRGEIAPFPHYFVTCYHSFMLKQGPDFHFQISGNWRLRGLTVVK